MARFLPIVVGWWLGGLVAALPSDTHININNTIIMGFSPRPRARTVKLGPRHLRTRPDPGQTRLGPHVGIPNPPLSMGIPILVVLKFRFHPESPIRM